uniref:ATP synthase complex subunit 8 n=1 Tax=Synbranchus marmoratus TaxID=181452 RepID=Q3BE79_SYNMA|nr:ATPase 8 [Synbranchus marmoratus]AAR13610.1 ATPase 8 [Synbranchus marmoratus]AAR13612.1 ATPase 8 [Synbranchus marmoratus]
MPQLNPSPWLITLIFSWLVFLALLPLKITAHTFPNEPQPKTSEPTKTEPWNWPWS